jgi:hypothetical protein
MPWVLTAADLAATIHEANDPMFWRAVSTLSAAPCKMKMGRFGDKCFLGDSQNARCSLAISHSFFCFISFFCALLFNPCDQVETGRTRADGRPIVLYYNTVTRQSTFDTPMFATWATEKEQRKHKRHKRRIRRKGI